MPTDYRGTFDERGRTYDDAMEGWPDARHEEFRFAVGLARPVAGERLLDVPAGGGYLRDHLPPGVDHVALEPSSAFAVRSQRREVAVVQGGLAGDALAPASIDVVVSVAGVHHEPDLGPLLRSWRRILVPGGRLVVADVARGSAEATFLDGFVGDHNGDGHAGSYLGDDLAQLAQAAGLVEVQVVEGRYRWWADDADDLARFCIALFGLRDVAPERVAEALAHGPGVAAGPDGRVGLSWGLRALVATSP